MDTKLSFILMSLLVIQCQGRTSRQNMGEGLENQIGLHEDIFFDSAQEFSVKEREHNSDVQLAHDDTMIATPYRLEQDTRPKVLSKVIVNQTGPCVYRPMNPNNSFIYEYTSPQSGKKDCSLSLTTENIGDLVYHRCKAFGRFLITNWSIQLSIRSAHTQTVDLFSEWTDAIFFSLWPFSVHFTDPSRATNKFILKCVPVRRKLFPCGGSTVHLPLSKIIIIKNPLLINGSSRYQECVFRIQAPLGTRISIVSKNSTMAPGDEILKLRTDLPNNDSFVLLTPTLLSQGNVVIVHYQKYARTTPTPWQMSLRAEKM